MQRWFKAFFAHPGDVCVRHKRLRKSCVSFFLILELDTYKVHVVGLRSTQLGHRQSYPQAKGGAGNQYQWPQLLVKEHATSKQQVSRWSPSLLSCVSRGKGDISILKPRLQRTIAGREDYQTDPYDSYESQVSSGGPGAYR